MPRARSALALLLSRALSTATWLTSPGVRPPLREDAKEKDETGSSTGYVAAIATRARAGRTDPSSASDPGARARDGPWRGSPRGSRPGTGEGVSIGTPRSPVRRTPALARPRRWRDRKRAWRQSGSRHRGETSTARGRRRRRVTPRSSRQRLTGVARSVNERSLEMRTRPCAAPRVRFDAPGALDHCAARRCSFRGLFPRKFLRVELSGGMRRTFPIRARTRRAIARGCAIDDA